MNNNTCPHCNYQDGWVNDEACPAGKEVKGDLGEFWISPLKMERNVGRDWHDDGTRKAHLCGCPQCNGVFIDECY